MVSPVFDHPGIEIDVDELVPALRDGSVVLVDVREDHEWEAGRIAEARHLPLSQLGSRLGEIDRDATIVVQCRVGGRSGMATQALREAGYDAWSLRGGILAWEAAGQPLSPEGGVVADH